MPTYNLYVSILFKKIFYTFEAAPFLIWIGDKYHMYAAEQYWSTEAAA